MMLNIVAGSIMAGVLAAYAAVLAVAALVCHRADRNAPRS